jgi:hypothetical protein
MEDIVFYGHLVYFVVILYICSRFGMLYQNNLATLTPNPSYPILLTLSLVRVHKV